MELTARLDRKEIDEAIKNYIRDVKKLKPSETAGVGFLNAQGTWSSVASCTLNASLDEGLFKNSSNELEDDDDF